MERSNSHNAYLSLPYFSSLDGLRAISVLLVLISHARGAEAFHWLRGANGVTVFFVLSGFLITTLALREEARQGFLDIRAFFIRRIFRILPVYYLALGLYCALILGLGIEGHRRDDFLGALPFYAFYFQEYPHFLTPGIPFEVSWSLGIEEKFYLLWPFLAFWLKPGFSVRVFAAGGLALVCFAGPALLPGGKFIF